MPARRAASSAIACVERSTPITFQAAVFRIVSTVAELPQRLTPGSKAHAERCFGAHGEQSVKEERNGDTLVYESAFRLHIKKIMLVMVAFR
jgi:hypothetical protein